MRGFRGFRPWLVVCAALMVLLLPIADTYADTGAHNSGAQDSDAHDSDVTAPSSEVRASPSLDKIAEQVELLRAPRDVVRSSLPEIKKTVEEEVAGGPPSGGFPKYGKLSTGSDAEVRQQVIESLSYFESVSEEVNTEVDEALSSVLSDEDAMVRCLASGLLKIQRYKTKKSIAKWQRRLRGDDFWLTLASGYFLAPFGDTAVDGVPEMINVSLEDRTPSEKVTAWVMRMVQAQLKGMVPGLMDLVLARRGGGECEGSLKSLAGQRLSVDQLIDLMNDEHSCMRRYSTFLLGFLGRDTSEVVATLGSCLHGDQGSLVANVSSVVREVTGEAPGGYSLKKEGGAETVSQLTRWASGLKLVGRTGTGESASSVRSSEVAEGLSSIPKLTDLREQAEEACPALRSLLEHKK